ncbi:transcription termination factor Rho [Roseimicrobium sp. ORNL1]|uniref:transcription termination factor Rho n=1 Tax=Roseimicrobium sp. ORNL1 TaxID=2711231 RepID=UPI0013E166FC|nr:transcription termination factor Rho [Roseimicrobium sp. ORNL1]QIF01383.1 transcription termination factor Rho [Roseimicrobium sp. ORNL1]
MAPEESRSALSGKRAAKKATAKKAVKKTAKKAAAKAEVQAELPTEAPQKKRAAKKSTKGAAKREGRAASPAAAEVMGQDGGVTRVPAADVVHHEPTARPAPVDAPVSAPAPAPTPAPAPAPAPVAEVRDAQARPAPQPQQHAPAHARAHTGGQQHQQHGQGGSPSGEGQHQQHGGHGRGRKWEKRNKFRDRFRDKHRDRDRDRDRDGQPQGEGEGQQQAAAPERPLGPPEPSEGILELTPKGYGFLRQKSRLWADFAQDPWVSPEWIRNLGLRTGMYIRGVERMGHRGPQVTEIKEVNGQPPEKARDLPLFEELKAVNPNKRIQLETVPTRLTTRVMDLITPVGRGQRGLIVAPPRAGKTTLLQHIAEAVTQNHPQMHLMILLVDERPEEVTEFRRSLPNAELHASSNDSDIRSHLRTAVLAIERAKRLVESGQHVFMLLDSITRMARAFNNAHKGGATATGGLGVGALEMPRRLFAAARNTRDAGSLTILATTLIETNSRMDDAIFQEFKGTGNLELVLDRKIAEQYIYPAVNIFRSGTRREELLLPPFQMEKVHMLRRGLAGHKPIDAIQRVITLMERAPNNAQMLIELPGRVNV